MGLTADIGLGGVMLSVERVEVLLKPMVGRHTSVDDATNRLDRLLLHGSGSISGGLADGMALVPSPKREWLKNSNQP
jgi:hypothetical protein